MSLCEMEATFCSISGLVYFVLRESVMVYTPSPDIAAPTILSIPSTWQYADTGYDVTITPADLATWAPGGRNQTKYATKYYCRGCFDNNGDIFILTSW